MGNQLRLPDGCRRLGGRPREHLGISVQDGPQRRLRVPYRLSAARHLCRRGRHARRADDGPQDRSRRRRRLRRVQQKAQVGRLHRRRLGLLPADVLQRPRRPRHALHDGLPARAHGRGRLQRAGDELLELHPARLRLDCVLQHPVRRLQHRYRHGRHTIRHREVHHGRHAGAVLHAALRHHLHRHAARSGRGLHLHVQAQLGAAEHGFGIL